VNDILQAKEVLRANIHAMLWRLADDPRLWDKARATIADGRNQLLWSIASASTCCRCRSVTSSGRGRSCCAYVPDLSLLLVLTLDRDFRRGDVEQSIPGEGLQFPIRI